MGNLHEKFCSENIDCVVSYATFTRLRPFWVCVAQAKDRLTCLCRRHENAQFKVEKLYQLKLIRSKSAEDLLSDMCCDVTQRSCMYRECEVCKDKTVQFTRPTLLESDKSVVVWAEWVTESDEYKKGEEKLKVKRIVKKIRRGTPEELKQALISEFDAGFSVHVFNLRHQFRQYKHIKESMRADEAVLHVDLSENWTCKHAAEIQACHFGGSQKQVTLHTGVAYTSDGFWSFATVSESMQHGPAAIHQLCSETYGSLAYRTLSCFCNRPGRWLGIEYSWSSKVQSTPVRPTTPTVIYKEQFDDRGNILKMAINPRVGQCKC